MSPQVAQRIACRFTLTCMLSVWMPCALALDPTLEVNQYSHTSWKIRDGFSRGFITAFAQGRDGYLWLGTELGLLRFDGVRATPFQLPAGMSLPHDQVRALTTARDGTLWIGTWDGLATWNGSQLNSYPRFNGHYINAIVEDREGTVWIGGRSRSYDTGVLCSIRDGKVACESDASPASMYEDTSGALWAVGRRTLLRWKPGRPTSYSLDGDVDSLQALGETAEGAIVILLTSGAQRLVDGKVAALPLPSTLQRERLTNILRDRDGALWIGTRDHGLLHLHDGRIDSFGRLDGLSGGFVVRLFEDREGSIWITTTDGIDRFRAQAAATYSFDETVASVMADQDGSLWVSTTRGLYRWLEGRMKDVTPKGLPEGHRSGSLFQDRRGRAWLGSMAGLGYLDSGRFIPVSGIPPGYIDAITEDDEGSLWIAHRDAGLFRLARDLKLQRTPWTVFGQAGGGPMAADPVRGGLWIGFFSGDVAHFVDGQVLESYSAGNGGIKGSISDVRVGADGTVWLASTGGLSRLKAGRIATLDTRTGLPCDEVHSMIVDASPSVWLYTTCGLVSISRSDLDAWAVAVDEGKPPQRVPAMVLDASDGVRAIGSIGTFSPNATESRDGKLWLVTFGGVTMVDPGHLPFNKLPPPVHVERIVADRKTYEPSSHVRLPPLVRDLQIDYTALSLVAPEKNLFRYKLEGRDRDWQDAGNRRQAFYSDLDPGNYRFRVIASNNSGVWNEEGASLDFSVAPAYWQTTWFRALCVLAFLALLITLYRLRVRQIARHLNATFDARLNERTRIARDLHDTLLQSFQGLLLRFQTALDLLPGRSAEAKQVLASAIDQAADAITEGRDAVQGLRGSTIETNDLADSIRALGEELASENGDKATLRVEVQGTQRALHPIVRDEIFRIAGEALRNAVRHASARQIEVEIRYDERQMRLRVRDDGIGIDPAVLRAEGRAGHFGLHGMRERSKLAGGKLTVWSGLDAGTEVELTIPASHAYAAASRPRSWLAEKLFGESTPSDS